jgi:hypothetical protein
MMSAFRAVVVICALVGVSASSGGAAIQQRKTEGTYRCRITQAAELKDDGSLVAIDRLAPGWGVDFHVDRATGLIAGGAADNATFASTEVLSTRPDNLFYVISKSSGPDRYVSLLSVRALTPGPVKPFVFVNSSWVYSGLCE